MEIKKAERRQAKARIGITGLSGSGKTWTALLIAKGIVDALRKSGVAMPEDPIGLVDTERKSASLYVGLPGMPPPWAAIDLEPPYSPERYMEAISALEKHGCLVIILDQISHAWAGEGGLLEKVDVLKAGARNKMQPWAQATPIQQRFVDRMLQSPVHIIATMRSKAEWVVEGSKVEKVGTAPVQREGMEYEFTTFFELDSSHQAIASKDRTRIFQGRRMVIDETWGHKLVDWLLSGAPDGVKEFIQSITPPGGLAPLPPEPSKRSPREAAALRADPLENGYGESAPPGYNPEQDDPGGKITRGQVRKFWVELRGRAKELGLVDEAMARHILRSFRVPNESSKEIRVSEFEDVLTAVRHFKREDLVPSETNP